MARSPRFYKPGSAGYDADRAKELRRQRDEAKQALTSARRAKAPKAAIDRVKRRQARIERELSAVKARQGERKRLSEDERRTFNSLGIATQNRVAKDPNRDAVLAVLLRYPDAANPVPKNIPDPFANAGESRNALWALYYSSRRKRRKRRQGRMREAA